MIESAEPPHNCPSCPRLCAYRARWAASEPSWHNGPVRTWLPPQGLAIVRVLIVGLAPGLRGANRTGRPFTGDASGAILLPALERHRLARTVNDTRSADLKPDLALVDCAITNAVRCLPPDNRPTGTEIANCRPYLAATIAQMINLTTIVTLGAVAHRSTVAALAGRQVDHPFGHGADSALGRYRLIASYHCSRYNMNTGRLTEAMFDAVIARAATGAPSSFGKVTPPEPMG